MLPKFIALVLIFLFEAVASAAIGKSAGTAEDELAIANTNKLGACLAQIGQPRVCDPDAILTSAELAQIDGQLAELERATNTNFYPAPPMWDFLYAEKCPQAGLTVSLILIKELTQPKLAKKMAANFHSKWARAHPCAKNGMALINFGGTNPEELFSAAASHNTDLRPKELARYFFRQTETLAKGRIGDALGEMIEEIRRNMMLRM